MRSRVISALRNYAERDGRGYPDWATRYVPVIRRLAGREERARGILEIGANENGFARFSGRPVVAVDLSAESLRHARAVQPVIAVVADASALPFSDGIFELCVSLDTFEHIPETRRVRAAAEVIRALSPAGTAVVSFPAGEAAAEAEERVRAAYRKHTGGDIPWLKEHAVFGLPDATAVLRAFQDAASPRNTVTLEKNTSLPIWQWMWQVLMCGWPGRGNAVFQVLLKWVTPLLIRIHWGRCYRAIIWIEPHDMRENGGS